MEDTKRILATLDGKNGKIELIETCIRITMYKSNIATLILKGKWDKSRIDEVHEVPRGAISKIVRGPDEFIIYFPRVCRYGGFVGYICIFFEKEQRSLADKMVRIFKDVEAPYDFSSPV